MHLADGRELAAKLVLRDEDCDSAFIRPTEPPTPALTFVDSAGASPVILDPVMLLQRTSEATGWSAAASLGSIQLVIDKPRMYYQVAIPTVGGTGLHFAGFDLAGHFGGRDPGRGTRDAVETALGDEALGRGHEKHWKAASPCGEHTGFLRVPRGSLRVPGVQRRSTPTGTPGNPDPQEPRGTSSLERSPPSAVVGFTFVAALAATALVPNATTASSSACTVDTAASLGCTWNNNAATNLDSTSYATTPTAAPVSTTMAVRPRSQRRMRPPSVLSAMRTPISGVRCDTA